MTKPFFFIVTALTFMFISVFHFLRLTFEWPILVGTWRVPSPLSGLIIIFAIFMVYWAMHLGKGDSKEEESKKEEHPEE